MSINSEPRSRPRNGPFGQLLKVVGALLALVAALMFSVVFFAVLAIAGLLLWLYLWWKTRALRGQMREHLDARMRAQAPEPGVSEAVGGEVIEGQAVRVADEPRPLGD